MFAKSLFIALLSLVAANAFAEMTAYSEGESFSCEQVSELVLHCEGQVGKMVVVKDNGNFIAIGSEGNELPKIKGIKKIVEDDEVLYESSGAVDSPNPYGAASMPESKSTIAMRANEVVGILQSFDDEWARDFVAQEIKYLNKEAYTPKKLEIQDASGENYQCTVGANKNRNIQCNYYACVNNKGEKSLAFIPRINRIPDFPVSSISINNGAMNLSWNGFKVIDRSNPNPMPLYDIPVIKNNGVDNKLLMPGKYQSSASALSILGDDYNDKFIKPEEDRCGGDNDVTRLIAERNRLTDDAREDLAKADLAHYLTIVDGQILSLYIDATKARGLGCSYDGMILSPEVLKHLDFLDKARAKTTKDYLTEDEAQKLFNKAKDMSDIPFGYKQDGCYARAHLMARRFEAMGIPVEKVWIKGNLKVPGTDIEWNFHVAPVVNVKNNKGEIVKYVIDPSLSDKAIPVDNWAGIMDKSIKGGVVKTSFPFPDNVALYQRAAVSFSSSDIYLPDNNEQRTEEQNMNQTKETLRKYTDALKGNGINI